MNIAISSMKPIAIRRRTGRNGLRISEKSSTGKNVQDYTINWKNAKERKTKGYDIRKRDSK